jgi:hypothetical protein
MFQKQSGWSYFFFFFLFPHKQIHILDALFSFLYRFQEFKISNVGLKAESCEIINSWLLKLREIPASSDKNLMTQLETFCAELKEIQKTLSKSISGISEYKDDKIQLKDPKEKKEKKLKVLKGRSNQV